VATVAKITKLLKEQNAEFDFTRDFRGNLILDAVLPEGFTWNNTSDPFCRLGTLYAEQDNNEETTAQFLDYVWGNINYPIIKEG
jgi:hypothetical protein